MACKDLYDLSKTLSVTSCPIPALLHCATLSISNFFYDKKYSALQKNLLDKDYSKGKRNVEGIHKNITFTGAGSGCF